MLSSASYGSCKHNISLQQSLKRFQAKWNNGILFHHNSIKLKDGFSLFTKEQFNELWIDVSKSLKLHRWDCFPELIIDISVSNYSSFDDSSFKFFIQNVLLKLKSLKRLKLHFSTCQKVTDQTLKNLSLAIGKRLIHLKRLSIEFSDCEKISDVGLQYFSKNIGKQIKHLKHLSLNFSLSEKISGLGVKMLSKNIARYHHRDLQHLTLDFSYSDQVSNQGVVALGTNLGRSFKNLKSLTLNLNDCSKITDVAIKHFGKNFKIDLEKFHLDFSGSRQITNQGVKEFSFDISRNVNNLKIFSLGFAECQKITGEGFEVLSHNICDNMKDLTSLTLDLSECLNITENERKKIYQEIKNSLKNLQHLSLPTRRCQDIDILLKLASRFN